MNLYFSIKTSKYSGSCNVIKALYVKVFNLMSRTKVKN